MASAAAIAAAAAANTHGLTFARRPACMWDGAEVCEFPGCREGVHTRIIASYEHEYGACLDVVHIKFAIDTAVDFETAFAADNAACRVERDARDALRYAFDEDVAHEALADFEELCEPNARLHAVRAALERAAPTAVATPDTPAATVPVFVSAARAVAPGSPYHVFHAAIAQDDAIIRVATAARAALLLRVNQELAARAAPVEPIAPVDI